MASAPPVMSINSDVGRVSMATGDREDRAKYAGHLIYSNIHSSNIMPPATDSSRLLPPNGQSDPERMTAGHTDDPDENRWLSSSRRTFCLYALFDLGLMFILWVIYTQLIGDTGYEAFKQQVLHYGFKTSLFDSVMLSAVRVTFLLLAYGLYRSSSCWVVALCTTLTCGVLVAKIFIFDFEGAKSANNPMSYCLLIISFVLSWSETWFVDFKMLPSEKEARNRSNSASRYNGGYGSTYLGIGRSRADDLRSVMTEDNTFYSPVDSPEGSDTEDGGPRRLPRGFQENDYLRLAVHATEVLWQYFKSPDSEWAHEKGASVEEGIVHSKKVKGIGKIFRLKCYVDMPRTELYDYICTKPEEQKEWNATVKECKVLQVVDDHTDILYIVSNEIAGGAIKSRDFISLRTWLTKNGTLLGAGMGVKHPDVPENKHYIRGHNGVGGYVYDQHPTDANKTLFYWFMNTDIKGWFPQKLIDANLGNVLLDFRRDLCKQVEVLNNAKNISSYPPLANQSAVVT